MKKNLFFALLCLLWAVVMIKTIMAFQHQDVSPTALYFGEMLANTWQAQFNLDLLVHTLLFACWIVYREPSRVVGILCALGAVYLGAIFSFGYLIVVLIRSKRDADRLLKGSRAALA